ncbi:Piwi domain-containing protein [Lentinula raphanica]|nr:Piwi domain-containing protein [Lentinula raphanica]
MNPNQHPRYGVLGTRLEADVNAFKLSWAEHSIVTHYDAMKPNFNGPAGKDIVIGGEKGNEIMQRLQVTLRPDLFPKPGAFDGKKNLFAFKAFNFISERFEVPWDRDQTQPVQGRRLKTVSIQIVRVNEVNISLLARVLSGQEQGNPASIGPGTDVATSLNMLQMFLQAAPKLAAGNLHKGKCVYVQRRRGNRAGVDVREFRMGPVKFTDGIFQSARMTIRSLLVNIDFSVGVVLQDMTLEQLCMSFFNCRDVRDIGSRCANQGNFDSLRQFLRDVKISIQIPGKSMKSKGRRAIRSLIRDVGPHSFDRNGVPTTIREYFMSAHAYNIAPRSLGVTIGNHEIFPIGVCVVPEQLYKSKLQPEYVREVLNFVPKNPRERLQRIKAGWQSLEYENSEFLRGADIRVHPEPLMISGRVLDPPRIKYGGDSKDPQADNLKPPPTFPLQKPGTWDMMKRRFLAPVTPSFVLVLNLTGYQDTPEMRIFLEQLFGKVLPDKGITVEHTSPIINDSGSDLYSLIKRETQTPQGLLVLAFLPENAAELYVNVKRVGDTKLGVPTQCIRWSQKLVQTVRNNRGLDQYLNNLALKINGRCGGINHVPASEAMSFLTAKPTMVIGADVSHPSPGSSAPSFASLVSSWDQNCSVYRAQMKVQPHRQEIIESLADMLTVAIEMFRKQAGDNKLYRIFFFRDGVSEGEFETVRQYELNVLKELLFKLYGNNRPKITFIIVGKRHHFRFFPRSEGPRFGADNSGNCPAGFVVDRGIEHPVYSDFYLQSQPGLKGTSIPAHYTVIEDENLNGKGDHLQSVAYALCHTYQRSTRSVKIPAPVYYADLVCQRAKFHFSPRFGNRLDGLSDAATDEAPEDIAGEFRDVKNNLSRTMYFM